VYDFITPFSNCLIYFIKLFIFRNAKLEKMGLKMPSFRKTGTTIVGVTTRDCVILAADTRATSDTIVMEKNCEKIHYIGKYMQYVYL
jgi:20S proteasome alpha/beta subunit